MVNRGWTYAFAALAALALAGCALEPEETVDDGDDAEQEWQEKDPIANVTYTTATSPSATTSTKQFASVYTAVGSRVCYARAMGEYCEVGTDSYTGSPAQSGVRIQAKCTGSSGLLGAWTTSTSPVIHVCPCESVKCSVRVENPP